MKNLKIAVAIALAFLAIQPALAGNTTFLTDKNGQITFPFSPPNRANSTPALIDNTTIGATTPAPGTFTTLKSNSTGLISATYYFTGTIAATNQAFFVAPAAMKIVSVSEVHSVAAGGVSTLGVYKDTGTNAPAAGTDVLSADFNLNATANTTQAGALSATPATLLLAAGDRISVKYVNAIQSSAGVVVTVLFAPQ